MRIGDREVGNAAVDSLLAMVEAGDTDVLKPEYDDLEAYRAKGGYAMWDKVKSGAISADEQIIGTYVHGLFDKAEACSALLNWPVSGLLAIRFKLTPLSLYGFWRKRLITID